MLLIGDALLIVGADNRLQPRVLGKLDLAATNGCFEHSLLVS